LASYPINIRSVTVAPDGQIFIATREGAFHSADSGKSWNHIVAGLPDKDITSVTYDGSHKRLLAISGQTGVVFESTDGGTPGSVDRIPDIRYAASALCTDAMSRPLRLMA
jgi:photosystem II stability/assembly factor-like uncharacterized protein